MLIWIPATTAGRMQYVSPRAHREISTAVFIKGIPVRLTLLLLLLPLLLLWLLVWWYCAVGTGGRD
jgi:hypothetical protein